MPLQAAEFSAHGKVKAFPARIADVVKVACVGTCGDELDVVAIKGAKNVGAPVRRRSARFPRSPSSSVCATTCFRSGSLAKSFGNPQGCSGFAHPSSMTLGARLASL